MSSAEWVGAVAEAISAAASVGALVGVVIAVRATDDTLKIERERDEERRQAKRREVAVRVSVWLDPISEDFAASNYPPYLFSHLNVSNVSEEPVFRVHVTLLAGTREVARRELAVLAPGKPYREFLADNDVTADPEWWIVPELDRDMRCAVEFEDTAGRRWRRGPDGRLEDLTGGV